MGDDKKWVAGNNKKDKPEFFNDQLGENASDEWDNESYDNANPGKNLKNKPKA